MSINEILKVLLDSAKKDLERADSLLKNDADNAHILTEYAYRLGVIAGLERAIIINNSPTTNVEGLY